MNHIEPIAMTTVLFSLALVACNTALALRDFEAVDTAAADATTSNLPIEDAPAIPIEEAPANRVAADAAPATSCDGGSVEDCTNGVDDDCNGLVDCDDPACGTFQCVPPVPTGWFGPVALWEAAMGAITPACPDHYDPLLDARAGLDATPASCSCTCTPSGQACAANGVFHADQTCANAPCATVTPSPDGTCSRIPANICGSGGSFDLVSMPLPTGGRCSPAVVRSVLPVTWALSARVCFYAGARDTPGGCAGTASCLARPTSPYGSSLCIYSSQTPPPAGCPVGFDQNPPVVLYSGVDDSRGCGACACSAPTGGACSGSIGIFADSACAAASGATTYTLGTSCQAYMGVNIARGAVRAALTTTSGSCSVAVPPTPMGSAAGALPTTICCL